ncbi:alpha/beta fold hydrolase [Maribacter antarcticus]|uniref:alpha/beta fold hydrolase n=1 Tax=Maribacter antarcticus TaxID=505250 RepID=UPI00047C20D5|nr:alpha/beta hydrolase [Maribacter antarcticus]
MKKIRSNLAPKAYGILLNLYALIHPKKAAEKAFSIFSKVRKGKVLPHQKAFLDRAKDKKIPVANNTIQTYRWSGKKETILLIHGWESNAWRWHKLIEKLQVANYNIIAFDAPAHGYSSGTHLHVPLYAQGLQAIIKAYSPKYLIGHSMGGMTALYNEYLFPDLTVKKIVTIGSPSEYHAIMTHFKQLLNFNNRVSKILRAYIFKRFGLSETQFSSARFVQTNTKKGLLFHDRLDTIAPHHASKLVHEAWKGSTLITTEGLGHSMHQDEVNEQIITFLAS